MADDPREHGLFISDDHVMNRVDDNQFESLCGRHSQACRFPNYAVRAVVDFKHPDEVNMDAVCGQCKRILDR